MADQLGEGTHLGRRTKRVILFRHLRGRARDEALDDSVVQSRAARKRVGRLRVCCAAYSKSEKAENELLQDAAPFATANSLRPQAEPRSPKPRGSSRGYTRLALRDRKNTRLNSSHTVISYAVFCLKKKKKKNNKHRRKRITRTCTMHSNTD